MNLDKLKKTLDEKWTEIQDEWEDIEKEGGNPFDKWNAFLDTLGHISSVSYEWHWHEDYGVPSLINYLYNLINSGKSVYVIDFSDGSNMSKTLAFDRDKIDAFQNTKN